MNGAIKPLLDYGALGAIVAVFLYYGIKTINALLPVFINELKSINKTMRLIFKSLIEILPRSAKQRILEEYLKEFSESSVEMKDDEIENGEEVR